MMQSLWTDTVKMPVFAPLHGELKTDVLVIGGGIAGILCAHQLKEAGVDYALVEANRLCSGITANTTHFHVRETNPRTPSSTAYRFSHRTIHF